MRILFTGWEVCFSMFLSHSSMFLNDCSFVMSYTSKMPAIRGRDRVGVGEYTPGCRIRRMVS